MSAAPGAERISYTACTSHDPLLIGTDHCVCVWGGDNPRDVLQVRLTVHLGDISPPLTGAVINTCSV